MQDKDAIRKQDEDVIARDEKDLVGLCREVRRGGITRRHFMERALLLGLSASAVGALAGACGEEEEPATPEGTTAADGRDHAHRDHPVQLDRLPEPRGPQGLREGEGHPGQRGLLREQRGDARQDARRGEGLRRHRALGLHGPHHDQEPAARTAGHELPGQLPVRRRDVQEPALRQPRRQRRPAVQRALLLRHHRLCPPHRQDPGGAHRLDPALRRGQQGQDQHARRRARVSGHVAQVARLLGELPEPGGARRGDGRS